MRFPKRLLGVWGYPDYVVSPNGRVYLKGPLYGLTPIPIRTRGDATPTRYVVLWKVQDLYYRVCVHRIVAEAYVPNPEGLPYVGFKDGNSLNCKASNLYWTASVHREGYGQLTKPEAREIREIVAAGVPQVDVARAYGVHPSTVALIKQGKRWAE